MCGLFGIIGYGISTTDHKVLRDLAVMSALRGIDATGIAFGSSVSKQRVIKKLEDPIWFFQNLTKQEDKDLDNLSHNFFMGHTRFATKGDMSIQAAQPFNYKNVIGTHNGTVDIDFKSFHSDSDALYSRIDQLGIKATIHMMKKGDAYALVYFDKKSETINFINNGKRKLYFALNDKRDTMYYASENGMLIAALWRNGIEAKPFFFSEDVLVSVKPHALKLPTGELRMVTEKLSPFEVENSPFVPSTEHQGEPVTDV